MTRTTCSVCNDTGFRLEQGNALCGCTYGSARLRDHLRNMNLTSSDEVALREKLAACEKERARIDDEHAEVCKTIALTRRDGTALANAAREILRAAPGALQQLHDALTQWESGGQVKARRYVHLSENDDPGDHGRALCGATINNNHAWWISHLRTDVFKVCTPAKGERVPDGNYIATRANGREVCPGCLAKAPPCARCGRAWRAHVVGAPGCPEGYAPTAPSEPHKVSLPTSEQEETRAMLAGCAREFSSLKHIGNPLAQFHAEQALHHAAFRFITANMRAYAGKPMQIGPTSKELADAIDAYGRAKFALAAYRGGDVARADIKRLREAIFALFDRASTPGGALDWMKAPEEKP